MAQTEVHSLGATRIAVGMSAIIRVATSAYQISETIKILSGGGTLEIVPPPIALSGASAAGWGLGYPLGASEAYNVSGPAAFYLAATGATMVATMVVGYSEGASGLI